MAGSSPSLHSAQMSALRTLLSSGRYMRRAALESRQDLHQVRWLVRRILVIYVPRSINRGEIFQSPRAQGTDGLSE